MCTSKVVFKAYNQPQAILLPPSLDELIDTHHPLRVINTVLDNLDIKSIHKQYKGGGTSSYPPRMLLKVLVYAYICNEYSSRRIEQLLKRHIHFMGLSAMNTPDHNTLNRFRSDRWKGVLKDGFSQIVLWLAESGHISLKDVNADGTKIEANANRYTFVWKGSITTHKEKMAAQVEELWDYAESIAAQEMKDHRPTSFAPTNPEQVAQTIEQINTALKDKR